MSQTVTITLAPQITSKLEPVAAETHESIETIVNAAIAEYLLQWERRRLREQLARQYDELAAMWGELAEDLASEKWLLVENEALLQFEQTLPSESWTSCAATFSLPTSIQSSASSRRAHALC